MRDTAQVRHGHEHEHEHEHEQRTEPRAARRRSSARAEGAELAGDFGWGVNYQRKRLGEEEAPYAMASTKGVSFRPAGNPPGPAQSSAAVRTPGMSECSGSELEGEEEMMSGSGSELEDEPEMAQARTSSNKRGGSKDTYNVAAMLLKLEQLRGGVDTDTDDKAWLETLEITATDPIEADDAEDEKESSRELAFYNQALAAVKSAQARLTKLDVPFLRPDDYFAEMLKTDQHMGKVKARLIRQQEGVFNTEQRRKQQHNKKFGKQVPACPPACCVRVRGPRQELGARLVHVATWLQAGSLWLQVQREKLEERARQKTSESHAKTDLRRRTPEKERRWVGAHPLAHPRRASRLRTQWSAVDGRHVAARAAQAARAAGLSLRRSLSLGPPTLSRWAHRCQADHPRVALNPSPDPNPHSHPSPHSSPHSPPHPHPQLSPSPSTLTLTPTPALT